jgi:hypothetical protein
VLWIVYLSGNALASYERRTRHLTFYSFKDREPPATSLSGAEGIHEDADGNLEILRLRVLQFRCCESAWACEACRAAGAAPGRSHFRFTVQAWPGCAAGHSRGPPPHPDESL